MVAEKVENRKAEAYEGERIRDTEIYNRENQDECVEDRRYGKTRKTRKGKSKKEKERSNSNNKTQRKKKLKKERAYAR